MTDRERRLGLENAKLAAKIHRQRIALSTNSEMRHSAYVVAEEAESVARENAELRRRVAKLTIENKALRIYVAEGKVKPEGLKAFIRRILAE